jgi:Cd2+/Zn2+-exporting ATPase
MNADKTMTHACACTAGNSCRNEDTAGKDTGRQAIRLAASGLLFLAALALSHLEITAIATVPLYVFSYLLAGGSVLLNAGRNIFKGRVFDEYFLISAATLGAFAIGYLDEGVAVMLFYRIGVYLQDLSAGRSRRSIEALMDIRPDTAGLITGRGVVSVSPSEVAIGDSVQVKPGEKFPLDGVVTEGASMADTSAMTGESVPREIAPGSEVLAGFVNGSGLLTLRVTKTYDQSAAAKILDLMRHAAAGKAPTEQFMTTFARYYTPAVTGAALLIAAVPPLVFGLPFYQWLYRALVFLVVSCPCALVLSIPLGFFAGLGAASRRGVLIKGGRYLDALNHVDTIVFDKTGTLTRGVFEVTQIMPHDGFDKEELLRLAAAAEAHSTHPIAVSVLKARGADPGAVTADSAEEIAGYGIRAQVGGRVVLAGSAGLMAREKIDCPTLRSSGTAVYVAADGRFAGVIGLSDRIKPGAADTILRLKQHGVKRCVMLTGDNEAAARETASALGLDEAYAELLPDQKVAMVETWMNERTGKGKLACVGDGIDDAPALARADVGVAMGALGSDAAIEAADAVLMTDEPERLLDAILLSRQTKRILWQNIIFSLVVKAIVLLLGACGCVSMWAAVFADVGVSLIAVLNALRILRVRSAVSAL